MSKIRLPPLHTPSLTPLKYLHGVCPGPRGAAAPRLAPRAAAQRRPLLPEGRGGQARGRPRHLLVSSVRMRGVYYLVRCAGAWPATRTGRWSAGRPSWISPVSDSFSQLSISHLSVAAGLEDWRRRQNTNERILTGHLCCSSEVHVLLGASGHLGDGWRGGAAPLRPAARTPAARGGVAQGRRGAAAGARGRGGESRPRAGRGAAE